MVINVEEIKIALGYWKYLENSVAHSVSLSFKILLAIAS